MDPLPDKTAQQARLYLESIRWPAGRPHCPHCEWDGVCYRLQPGAGSSTRDGLWRCGGCRKQFSVTVKTVFEGGKLPLPVWLRAIERLCSRQEGWTVRELQGELGISYRSAWALYGRIRYAVTQPPFPPLPAPAGASLYPLTPAPALACLLAIPPERSHPLAADRRHAYLEKRRSRYAARRDRPPLDRNP